METKINPPVTETPANWSQLKTFKIFSVTGGNQLYSNGYQQLEVKVVVEVVNDGWRSVALSQSELDSIVLMDALTGVALVKDRNRGDKGVWKYTEEKDALYRQLPSNGPIKGSVPPGDFVYSKSFYVTTSSDVPIELLFSLTRADGRVFRSNRENELGALMLNSLPPAIYRNDQYSVLPVPAPYSSNSPDIARVAGFKLELIIDQHKIYFVAGVYMGRHLQVGSSDDRYSGYFVVGYASGKTIMTSGPVQWEKPDSAGKSLSTGQEVALILAFGKVGGAVWVRDHCDNTVLELRDMYGNIHALRVGLDEKTLTVWVAR